MSQADDDGNTKPPAGGTTTERGLPALVYKGEVIHERHEMLSLTDMWRASGSDKSRQPSEWLASSDAKRFIDALSLILKPENSGFDLVTTKRGGRTPGTWANWQIALAYAKYLSPEFHMWCNTVVRERMEGAAHHAVGISEDDRRAIGGITKGVVAKAIGDMMPSLLTEAVATLLPALVREQVATRQHAVVNGVCAGQVLDMAGFPQRKGLRGLPSWVSRRLFRFHVTRGVKIELANLGSRSAYVYDPLVCREWLAAGGKAEIEKKVAERRGQGALRLV